MFKWYIIRDPTVCDSMETVGYAGCSCCFKNDVDMLALVACHLTTAAVAALPDMFLPANAKWSAAGGFATFGDEVGFGATLAIRGNENWSFGGSAALGGSEATTKVQVHYAGF